MKRFIIKKILTKNLQKRNSNIHHTVKKELNNDEKTKNKPLKKEDKMMETKEKIKLANEILDTQSKVKKIKKEKGLIERTESSKIILTEDNKELLIG